VQALLQAQNIPFTLLDGAERYDADEKHWTPNGHRLVADRLRSLLIPNTVFSPADFAGRSSQE